MRNRQPNLYVIDGGMHRASKPNFYELENKSEEVNFRLSVEDLDHLHTTQKKLPGISREDHMIFIVLAMDFVMEQLSGELSLDTSRNHDGDLPVSVNLARVDQTPSSGAWCKLRCDIHVKQIIEKWAERLGCSNPLVVRHFLRVCSFLVEETEKGTLFYKQNARKGYTKKLDLNELLREGISSDYHQKSTA